MRSMIDSLSQSIGKVSETDNKMSQAELSSLTYINYVINIFINLLYY